MTPQLYPPQAIEGITSFLESHAIAIVIVVGFVGLATFYGLIALDRVRSRPLNKLDDDVEDIDSKIP